jgi:glutamine amidotransferase
MAEVTVVNYGLGNIQAFVHIYNRLNIAASVATTAEEVSAARRLILPGVGAFDWAMARLDESGMRSALDHAVLDQKRPVLGVCVGMQMMARSSEEGELPGLGWIDSVVRRFDERALAGMPTPHMGWNDVRASSDACLFRGLDAPRYYFLHSYYFAPHDPADALATADYGGEFAAAVRRDNVYGTQFHPEKSHRWGVELLRNFAGCE